MLALIAGEGALPGVVMDALLAGQTPFMVCEVDGHPSQLRADHAVTNFRVEHLGSFIKTLKDQGVDRVCFAGRVARPKLDPSAIDAATMPLLPRMMTAMQVGDDQALRVVLGFFEEAGMDVIAAHDIAPDLLPKPGILTRKQPSDQNRKDAVRGAEIIKAMAAADVGQACVVAGGQALAIEALPGTDWMLRSLLGAKKQGRDPALPPGGILCKAAKTGQDRRVDMPTIGIDTVRAASLAGLEGIVIEAGSVMVLDQARTIAAADELDLFIWV